MAQDKPYDKHLGYRQSFLDIGPRFLLRTSLMRRMLKGEGQRLLDVGCGDGFFMETLIEDGFQCTGLDPSARACELCQERMTPLGGQVHCAEIHTFHPPQPFDVVACGEVLEHVDDDVDMLKHIHRLLKPDGALVLTVPLDMRLWNAADARAGHKRRYTRDEILAKLESAGFQVEKYIVWGYPITRAAHFWIRRQQDKMMSASSSPGQSRKKPILLWLKPLLRLARYLFWIDNLFNFAEKGVGIVVKARR
jgi:SAM-dependent methyltransferase